MEYIHTIPLIHYSTNIVIVYCTKCSGNEVTTMRALYTTKDNLTTEGTISDTLLDAILSECELIKASRIGVYLLRVVYKKQGLYVCLLKDLETLHTERVHLLSE